MVVDARFAVPVDVDLLLAEITEWSVPVITVEDHALAGGFGSCVLEACNAHGFNAEHVHRLGIPRRWFYQDSRANQLAAAGIDAAGIVRAVEHLSNLSLPRASWKAGTLGA